MRYSPTLHFGAIMEALSPNFSHPCKEEIGAMMRFISSASFGGRHSSEAAMTSAGSLGRNQWPPSVCRVDRHLGVEPFVLRAVARPTTGPFSPIRGQIRNLTSRSGTELKCHGLVIP